MTQDIQDFSELAQSLKFKYEENEYHIPSFSKPQLKKLMKMNQRIQALQDDQDLIGSDKELDDKDKEDKEDKEDFFDIQEEFLAKGILKKIENGFEELKPEHFVSWPVIVKTKAMKLIGDQISNVTKMEDTNEKKS